MGDCPDSQTEGCCALGQVYSHLSEEERQVVRIGMGNGAGVRRMAMVPGRHASTVGREIRRDTWLPSNESESYRPCRPRRLRTGPWTGRCYVAGPARRRAMRREAVARRPRRLAAGRLWAWVAERSRRGRSPPLICGRLAMEHPGGPVTRCRAAAGAGARPAAGVRAAAASRCARRSANTHAGRTTGAVSASGRPTASSARAAACAPRSGGAPVSPWPRSCPTRPPPRAWRRRRPCSPGCRPPPAPERRMTTAPSSPGTPSCATNRAWPRISPTNC
ncbi:hypothetical protein CJ196_07385 [Bifidobacterium breve]|nr:hypothetical protein CYJ38_06665 [Bifidobacterium breve]PMC73095.1 hypothetical protein CJ196_07385 [Bifidobacterium breve]